MQGKDEYFGEQDEDTEIKNLPLILNVKPTGSIDIEGECQKTSWSV